MWQDIFQLLESPPDPSRPGDTGGAAAAAAGVEGGEGSHNPAGIPDKAFRVFLHDFGMKHDLGDKS